MTDNQEPDFALPPIDCYDDVADGPNDDNVVAFPGGAHARKPSPEPTRFKLEDWNDIGFSFDDEWRVKHVLPMRGVALLYGKSQGFKSFVALHLMLSIANGLTWAGKRVEQGKVVYIAAEGAAGMRKRIRRLQDERLQEFRLGNSRSYPTGPISGTDRGDLPELIRSIEKLA